MGERIVKTLCRMCDDRCGIDVTVRDGRVVDVAGDPDHLWSRGHVCVKARAAGDLVHHPDRLLRPLKRTPRGWQEIELGEALDEIAERLAAVRDRHGARSLGIWKGEALGFGQQEDDRAALRSRRRYARTTCASTRCAGRRASSRTRLVLGAWPVAGLRARAVHRAVGGEPAALAPDHDAVHQGGASQRGFAGGGRPPALSDRAPGGHPRRRAARHGRRPGLGAHPRAHRHGSRGPCCRRAPHGRLRCRGRVRGELHAGGRGGGDRRAGRDGPRRGGPDGRRRAARGLVCRPRTRASRATASTPSAPSPSSTRCSARSECRGRRSPAALSAPCGT